MLTPLVSSAGPSTSSYGGSSGTSYGGDAMLSIPMSTALQIAPQVDDQPSGETSVGIDVVAEAMVWRRHIAEILWNMRRSDKE
ncbi:hypothetical protein L6452_08398 [Arctium lappa]|uniref:Uncharacterized protein n=1 Tax=Arctium lappa TaxID=4217 RepID=A0ACB9DI05_ARCLA|nr:hypothetical protein L6452_08398 [Arctium lappa]